MKLKTLFAACLISTAVSAQTATDPIIMVVNGQPVPRSEFEYSFNKNNSEGVIDKKSVQEYVDLFINYKLKVFAALDAHYDTLQSYKDEFAMYRDQQVLPMLVTDDDIEAEAHKIYDETVEIMKNEPVPVWPVSRYMLLPWEPGAIWATGLPSKHHGARILGRDAYQRLGV